MFSMCSELTPRARIPDTRIPQLMQPCLLDVLNKCPKDKNSGVLIIERVALPFIELAALNQQGASKK